MAKQTEVRIEMVLQENRKLNLKLKEKITELEKFRIINSDLELKVHELTVS